jgi:hypothetical protein
MTITEQRIDNWDNITLRYKKNKYPVPLEKSLPKMYFVSLFVGSRGSGKTYSIVKLLKQYEKYGIVDAETHNKVGQRIVIFSPTADANPVFTSLKHFSEEDLITNYSDDKLLNIIEDVKAEREETLEYQRRMKLYKKFLRIKDIDELAYDELMELELMNFDPPPEPKYPHGCVNFFILDDLVGSAAFKSTGKSALTNLVLKNRHLGINIMVATQNLKAIPKSIRTNTSLFVIFRYANKKIITDDLYEEVSNTLKLDQFEEIFDYATKEDHDCLVIDFSQPKEERFKKNFDTVLKIII